MVCTLANASDKMLIELRDGGDTAGLVGDLGLDGPRPILDSGIEKGDVRVELYYIEMASPLSGRSRRPHTILLETASHFRGQ